MTRKEEFYKLWKRGIKLVEDGRDKEAEPLLNDAATRFPDLWCALAVDLSKQGEDQISLTLAQRVLDLCKSNLARAGALNTVGLVFANKGYTEEGLQAFKEAHKLKPDDPDIMSNIALANRWLGNIKDAEHWLARALGKNPWMHEAEFERALITLLKGDYKTGFERYECRFRSKNNGLPKITAYCPEWDGTNGKKLFVYSEQGAGDAILMMRYAKLLKERGLFVSWAFQDSMVSLAESMGLIDHVFGAKETKEKFPDMDCHIPAFSLPRIFGTTIETIPPAPYIPWRFCDRRLGQFTVGIAWRGSVTQNNDYIRSTSLAEWGPVLAVPGVMFESLQVDGADEALLYPSIRTFQKPSNWLDTATRLCGVDLVITVDTSILHLAGAMGVPCWCAMHCRPYFVYPLTCEHTPWYPSVKLFKQNKAGEWKPVFERIAYELARNNKTHD